MSFAFLLLCIVLLSFRFLLSRRFDVPLNNPITTETRVAALLVVGRAYFSLLVHASTLSLFCSFRKWGVHPISGCAEDGGQPAADNMYRRRPNPLTQYWFTGDPCQMAIETAFSRAAGLAEQARTVTAPP
jgi:hypothetical protein